MQNTNTFCDIADRKKKIHKAFTLVEMLIVLVIFWILSLVMFRTYTKISDISFRTQREKNLNQELVYVGQVLQNLSDDYRVDMQRYAPDLDSSDPDFDLVSTQWIVDVLYLTGKNIDTEYQNVSLYSAWNCVSDPLAIVHQSTQEWCWLEMKAVSRADQTTQTVALTHTGKILFTPVKFKVIPYASPEEYYAWTMCNLWSVAACIWSPWFRILTTAYIPYYRSDKWLNNVRVVVQNFFNT